MENSEVDSDGVDSYNIASPPDKDTSGFAIRGVALSAARLCLAARTARLANPTDLALPGSL